MKQFIALLLAIVLVACAQTGGETTDGLINSSNATGDDLNDGVKPAIEPAQENLSVKCADPRPEGICTKEYMPVCGDNGQTYGNKCEACSDTSVSEYTSGACAGTPDETPDKSGRTYQSRDLDMCARIKYACEDGMQPFSDETGCGCEPADNFVECSPEQRGSMCTMQYDPVCADVDTGIRCITTPCPSTEQKTYGNACSACSDEKVYGYRPGACDA